jgi:hypothetical protein
MSEKRTPEPLLDTERAGKFLGDFHLKTMMRWRARGVGPRYIKMGGRVFYRVSDLEEFLAASVVDPKAAAISRNKRTRKQQRRAVVHQRTRTAA